MSLIRSSPETMTMSPTSMSPPLDCRPGFIPGPKVCLTKLDSCIRMGGHATILAIGYNQRTTQSKEILIKSILSSSRTRGSIFFNEKWIPAFAGMTLNKTFPKSIDLGARPL